MYLKATLLFCCSLVVYANCANSAHNIMPDSYSWEYPENSNTQFARDAELEKIVRLGNRNLEWINYMNQFRDEKLSYSTPENRRTYPVDAPSIYNKTIILSNYNSLIDKLPAELKSVLLDGADFTQNPPIDTQDYLDYCLEIDYVYQTTLRWQNLLPYIEYYKSRQSKDIRGYYHLKDLDNRTSKLQNYVNLPDAEQAQLSAWLIGMCNNSLQNKDFCAKSFKDSLNIYNGDASNFYNKHESKSREIYTSYYKIPYHAVRHDIRWQFLDAKQVATVPFRDDVNKETKEFLANIENEWQWGDWQLKLNYMLSNNIPYIEFKPNATPHVNALGGNQIVMDANTPLTEWDVKWTIRHEFGHVLGFPDCYEEFYDESEQAFVNYQLDVSNLMCSRKGKLQETHYNEMRRNYS